MGRISLVLMNVEGSDETVGMAIAKASELIGNMACDGAGGGNPSRGAGDKSPPGAPVRVISLRTRRGCAHN